MKKTDLIKELSNQSHLPRNDTKLVIDTLESFLVKALREQNDKIKLGIGHFYKATNGQPKFSPSPKFTKQVKAVRHSSPQGEENSAKDANSLKSQPSNQVNNSKQAKAVRHSSPQGVRKNVLRS